MKKELGVIDIKAFMRRRKKSFIFTFLTIFLLGFAVALILPPIYRSEATILIQDQQIPEDYVRPATRDFAEERIEKINQQVLSRPKLLNIIKQFNLYPKLQQRKTPTEIVSKIKNDISLELINAEKRTRKGGRLYTMTVAFRLSYEGKDPETVQKVTENLANLYLDMDVKSREQLASVTTGFLKDELERIKIEMSRQEKEISDFEKKHLRGLPSDKGYNLQVISRLERELDQKDMKLRLLNEKKIHLTAQLTNVDPLTPIVIDGEGFATNPNQRLKELNLQLVKLQSIYSEKHPDIKKLKREIKELESQVQISDDSVNKIKQLKQKENELAELSATHGPEHPDVKALRKEVNQLSSNVDNLITEKAKIQVAQEKPDNPIYINLQAQIESINLEINALEKDKKEIFDKIAEYQNRIGNIPLVEKNLKELNRDYKSLQDKYEEISGKLMAAQVAQEMQDKEKGQRFSITSPAYIPLKPSKPKRVVITLIGFLAALGLSYGFVTLKDSMDNGIRTPHQIRELTGTPVLSSIPYIITDQEKTMNRVKFFVWFFVIAGVIGGGLFLIDQYIFRLDRLWALLLERLQMFV
jgi:uncharacterized protein involved in exopolysaccharide biosynthesis